MRAKRITVAVKSNYPFSRRLHYSIIILSRRRVRGRPHRNRHPTKYPLPQRIGHKPAQQQFRDRRNLQRWKSRNPGMAVTDLSLISIGGLREDSRNRRTAK